MQLYLKLRLKVPLSLPLSYHHIVQAALYHSMKEPNQEKSFYHEKEVLYGKRNYRLFTFGLLKGNYQIQNRQIVFFPEVELEVRSVDLNCLKLLRDNLSQNGIRLGSVWIRDVEVELSDDTIEEEEICIQMNSPICVYMTDPETGYKTYWEPDDPEFAQYVNENFQRKYKAIYGVFPDSDVELETIHFEEKDKYVTKYKGYFLSGWKGIYRLSGKRKYLDFLYQMGLGSKNAQGFGMFEVINEY